MASVFYVIYISIDEWIKQQSGGFSSKQGDEYIAPVQNF